MSPDAIIFAASRGPTTRSDTHAQIPQHSKHKRFCCKCLKDAQVKGGTVKNAMFVCAGCQPKGGK
jgi:hypothetical protein